MQTLDIECPSCGEMLELDAGFAGGVCRCSNCGTLMTVPSSAGKPESLTKPTRSASSGSGGTRSMGTPDTGTQRGSRPSKPKKKSKGKGKPAKGGAISATIEAGEYRTSSGKVIRVDETMRVPMAEKKKKQIRMATTIVFFSIVAAVVVVAVIGIIAITGGPGGPGGGSGSGDVAYDPAANPYELPFANVMGLPVTGRTVVVVEASEYSGEWASIAGDMIGTGLSHASSDGEIALIGAAGKPVAFDDGAMRGMPINANEVRGWFENLPAEGEANVAAAITAALEQDPDTLIIVHGYADTDNIQAWDALLDGKENLKLHTVFVDAEGGNSSPELEGWAAERGGEAVVLSIDQIEYLKEAAAEAVAEKE